MAPNRRTVLRTGALALAGTLAGCSGGGGSSDGSGSGDGGSGSGATVAMSETSFVPLKLDVGTGTRVVWTNQDGFEHDVTSAQFHDVAAEWDVQKTAAAGESVSHTFEEAGVYEYVCTIHGEGSMCGAILVGDVSLSKSLPCESDSGGGGGGYGAR